MAIDSSFFGLMRPSTTKASGSAKSAAASAISGKVAAALGGGYTAQLKAAAASDAEAGAYGSAFRAVRNAQMQKTVSPDRSTAISQVASAISSSTRGFDLGETKLNLAGLPYTAKVNKGEDKTTAEIYDGSGAVIARYDSEKGVWSSVSTKDEQQFQEESEKVYRSAYQQVRAGILSSQKSGVSAGFSVKG